MLARLSEALFVETLRRYVEDLPEARRVGSPDCATPWWRRR